MSMRSMRVFFATSGVLAALVTAPAHAEPGARACPEGQTGVIVSDDGGDRATVCVRTQDVVDAVTAWGEELSQWPASCEVYQTPTGVPKIRCDKVPLPHL